MKHQERSLCLNLGICAALCASLAGEAAAGSGAVIVPVGAAPGGQTYGRWAAEWWQWALGVPAATSPVLDPDGQHCGERQVGDVWFLAGSFGADPVVRSCDVPQGKSIFLPLINSLYGAFLNDPPETRTEEFVREVARCTEPAVISVSIDGRPVAKPTRFFTGLALAASPLFNIQLPPDNLLGADATQIPELVLSPSAEQGYYLFISPLPPGPHVIAWTASGCAPDFAQDVTYHITVTGPR